MMHNVSIGHLDFPVVGSHVAVHEEWDHSDPQDRCAEQQPLTSDRLARPLDFGRRLFAEKVKEVVHDEAADWLEVDCLPGTIWI